VSDAAERELLAQARGGDVGAEAELLRRRLRSGQLQRGQLELAAGLGSPSARLLLESQDPPAGEWWVERWLEGIQLEPPWRGPLWVRLALAVARPGLELTGVADAEERLDEVRRRLEDPHAVLPFEDCFRVTREAGVKRQDALRACRAALGLAARISQPSVGDWGMDAIRAAVRLRGEAQVQAEIQVALVPWLLGFADPVRPSRSPGEGI
jgi:hypothetical protein